MDQQDTPPIETSTKIDWPTSVTLRSVSLTGIFLIMLVASLSLAAEILIPITIAYSLSLLLSPLVSKMSSYRIPAPLTSAVVVLCFVTTSVFAIYSLFEPAESWIERAPSVAKDLKLKLGPMLGSLAGAQEVADNVGALMNGPEAAQPQVNVTMEPSESRIERIARQLSSVLSDIGIVVVLLYFLLAAGDTFLNKFVSLLPSFQDKRTAVQIIRDIQRDISRYLITRTLINIGLGFVIACALYLLDVPNPMLWGAVAALLNFAPYVGPAITLIIITVAALISLDSVAQALVVPAVVLSINIVEGEFVSHQLIGKRLALSPVIVFISIVFWGWLWGIAGALLAIPIIAALNVIFQHIDSLKPISEFIRDSDRE